RCHVSRKFVELAASVAFAVLFLTGCALAPSVGSPAGEVRDLDTGALLPDVILVGSFGYVVNNLHSGWIFRCVGVELVTSNAQGEFSFTRGAPSQVFAYREGYWHELRGAPGGVPVRMTKTDPLADLDPKLREEIEGQQGSALARRLDTSRQILLECHVRDRSFWRELRPLHVAMAREAMRAASEDDRALAWQFCRRAAGEADKGRLERPDPECLAQIDARR
ncbi:MAG TPA: hypothetical protein VLT92_05195, partial [Burkholderiales bacterium]|nr:hypothetical protein [Burkholderiales bacterium]